MDTKTAFEFVAARLQNIGSLQPAFADALAILAEAGIRQRTDRDTGAVRWFHDGRQIFGADEIRA